MRSRGKQTVGAAEIFEGVNQRAARQSELPGPQKAARGQIHMLQALGKFAQRGMPRRIFRVEQGNAFAARQRFDTPLLLLKEFDGGAVIARSIQKRDFAFATKRQSASGGRAAAETCGETG